MLITKEKTQYYEYALSFDYNQSAVDYCRYLKSVFGWTEFDYDPIFKKWRWKDPGVIGMMMEKFPIIQVESSIWKEIQKDLRVKEEEKEKEQNAIRIKQAKTSNLEIKGIKGELYDYQRLGVEFFMNSGGRAILSDDMGTGKTLQSLAYVVNTDQKRTLVICPASVKFSWQNEVGRWTKLKSFVVDSKTKFSNIPHDVDVVIINYNILKKHFNELMKYQWNCLVSDESQMLRNSSAIRTKAVKAISRNIPSVLLLSGTPLVNRPIELFNLLNIIDPKVWPSWYNFAVRYAGGRRTQWGFEANGSTNLEELKQRIEKYFLRRTKEEVLPQLPAKIRTEIPIELSGEFGRQYKTAASDLAQYLKNYKKRSDESISKTVQDEKLTRINYLRQINSMGKIETAKELIKNIIDNGGKVLVFSCFNAPLLELQKTLQDVSVMIIGSTNVNDRGEIVKKFQEDPNIKVFFGGVLSAGSGITLTAASNILFLDFSWSPSDMKQAEDRAHRLGAEYESLNIYQITSRGTIDDFMKKLLIEKQEIFDKLFEGRQEKTQGSILDEMVEDIEKNY